MGGTWGGSGSRLPLHKWVNCHHNMFVGAEWINTVTFLYSNKLIDMHISHQKRVQRERVVDCGLAGGRHSCTASPDIA